MRVALVGAVGVGIAAVAWCGCNSLRTSDPPKVEPQRVASVAGAEQTLALRLLVRLGAQAPGTNTLIGPDSLLSAMTLAASGANAETRAQLLGAIGFDPSHDAPLEAMAALQHTLAQASASDGVQLAVVHRLWIDEGQRLTEAWRQRVDAVFEHAFETLDFRNAPEDAREEINEFVADATDDKIVDLLPPGSVDGTTRLVVTNATWFKGLWEFPFDAELTLPGAFTKRDGTRVDVPMMKMNASVGFAEKDDEVVVELPYQGGELAMLVIVPKDIAGLAEWPADAFTRKAASLNTQEVDVVLPRFTFRGKYALVDTFRDLGVTDAFDQGRADFSAMEERRELFIAGIHHQAFIDVDEQGTEAAAATGVTWALKSAPARIPVFRADRPFVFAIRHRATGAILFAGVVEDPSKT
ncbi:MAG: serpin family protein [Planctomycetes bacterium]|nr:serpin family protein [Planctomycetota bacterium]MCC7171295.1 serpin family protein [Planctomycetota bacterium]